LRCGANYLCTRRRANGSRIAAPQVEPVEEKDALSISCISERLEVEQISINKRRHDERFMILVKATKETETGVTPEAGLAEPEKLTAEMATYHEELAKAGALLDALGLQPSSKGWRIQYSLGKRTVIDGPVAETKELIAVTPSFR
jgi:YCII-related domain